MTIKKEPSEIISKLESISDEINGTITLYLEEYADYGWDSTAETLANVSAQIYMEKIRLTNATVKQDRYQ